MKKRVRAPKVEAAPEPPKEIELPEDKEGLFAEAGKLLEDVDAQMAAELDDGRRIPRSFGYMYGEGEVWRVLERRRNKLRDALRSVHYENPDEERDFDEFLWDELVGTSGIAPSFARPGCWLEWVDFIPILCVWHGFIQPDARFEACSFGSFPVGGGARNLHRQRIEQDDVTVRQMFRRALVAWTDEVSFDNTKKRKSIPVFRPQPLTADGRLIVEENIRRYGEWLRPALKRGAADPIPMPKHVRAIQMALA
jgi:hypothetical protein